MASLGHNISPDPMLGCILEIIAVENLITVTEALLLMSMRKLSGFEQSFSMDLGVEEEQKCLPVVKVDRPCVGGDIIDGSDSRNKVPSKSTVTSFEVGECKDAGSDDDEDDDDDDDDDDDEDAGEDEEDDLSADEGGQGDKENNLDEDEEGEEEANGNEEEDEDDDDDDDGEDGDDDEEEDDDDEEDEEPPAKKKK